MSADTPRREEKKIVKQIEIDAPVEAVWRALSNPAELTRWFPLEASVEPGEGGKLSLSWGPGWEISSPIEVWEPNRRLKTAGQMVSVEWTLEARGGKTIVTITQSGFLTGADWEQEFYDSTDYGWRFMLVNLRHYLERHAGQPRLVAWSRYKSSLAREAIHEKLTGARGIFEEGTRGFLNEGTRYALQNATGELWTGRTEFVVPPRGFCVSVDSLKDALVWLTIEGSGEHDVQLWFSTYGLPQAQVSEIEKRWAGVLEKILGS
jgi:uncharacterized protein YndB with AHSA1/START domain